MSQYIAVAKLDYVPVANDDDEVEPPVIGALKKGLEALLAEDARNQGLADQLWEGAKMLLAEDSEDDTGAGAEGSVEVQDDFQMSRVSGRFAWGYDGYGSGWGYGG